MTGLFPGQGIAFDGQFAALLKSNSRLRDYFQQADAFAKSKSWPWPSLYLTSPQRITPLYKNKLKNLALFTLEVGLFEEMVRLGIVPRRLAGYSFGEYAAWTAAGSLSFAQMLEVIYWREELAPPAFSAGTSILVGASEERIREALKGFDYSIGNRNLPEQIILTVSTASADPLVKKLFAQRIPCQKLTELSQPYHSALLSATAEAMAKQVELLNLEISPPRVPVYSSELGRWVNASTFSRKEFQQLLSRQLTSPVDFVRLHAALAEQGIQTVLELGPGSSCSDLLRKLTRGETFRYLPLTDYFRGESAPRTEFTEKIRKSKFVSVVSKVVSRLTGYEVEDIVIEDRFQEDLGIDSLKKAEVIFEVLHEAKIDMEGDLNTSRFKSLGDLVEYFEVGKENDGSTQNSTAVKAPFLRFEPGWVKAIDNLHLPHREIHQEYQIAFDKIFDPGFRATLLEVLRSSKEKPLLLTLECRNAKSGSTVETWSAFARFWRDLFLEAPDVAIHFACLGKQGEPLYEGASAFLKSVRKERPQFTFLPISAECGNPSSTWIWRQIQRPVLAERNFAEGQITERRWSKHAFERQAKLGFKPTKMVWLGGAGGIAFELLTRYPSRAKADLHLLGRRNLDDLLVQDRIGMLELEFASVTYHQVDASDAQALFQILDKIQNDAAPIDMVVNATGVDRSALLKVKTDQDIDDDLKQKIPPAENLAAWCALNQGAHQVHFSSVVAIFGNASQSVYAMANASLTASVLKADKESLVIHWPPWRNTGMTSRAAVRLTLMESGAPLLLPDEGAKFFWEDIERRKAGEVSYINDPYFYREQLLNANFEGVFDFMGGIASLERPMIEKRFDLNIDSYLMDHRIQDKACLPAAAAMTMFLQTALLLEGHFLPLQNFEMTNMLIVDHEGLQTNLSVRPIAEGMKLQLRSLLNHATATLYPSTDSTLMLREPIKTSPGSEEIPIQHYYNSNVLFHGPKFQVLNKAWKLSSQSFRAKIERSRLSQIYGNEFFDNLMPTIDGLFQLLVIGGYLRSNIKALPVGVKVIKFNPETPWTDNFWIQAEIQDLDSQHTRGSGVIFNDLGELVAELHGITAKEGVAAHTPNQ